MTDSTSGANYEQPAHIAKAEARRNISVEESARNAIDAHASSTTTSRSVGS